MSGKNKVLLIRLSSIGDVVQASSVPRHLAKKYPGAEIHWLVRKDNEELIAHNPFLSEIISFERSEGFLAWLKLGRRLSRSGYTHVYDMHCNLRSRILCAFFRNVKFLRRSKTRVRRFLLFLFKINLFPRPYRAVESYVSPLKKWNIDYDGEGGDLHLPPAIYQSVERLLPLGPRWIAIAPATAWPKKTWPLKNWKALIQNLLKTTDFSYVILGGPTDLFCRELVLNQNRVVSLQGQLTLLQSAAILQFCDSLVAADTGLLHMAESLKKDVVGILGPTPFGHPARKTSVGLQAHLWCSPCSKDGRGLCINLEYQKCMKLLSPTVVEASLRQVLSNS